MRRITPKLTDIQILNGIEPKKIATSDAIQVESFSELVSVTAEIAYSNIDYLIFYRGQHLDYKNKSNGSSFYPSIYRGEYESHAEVKNKFLVLEGCSNALVETIKDSGVLGYNDIKKRKFIQWSILQHYEICETPFLDFTQSLRVACSFALNRNKNSFGFVYVFGLPYVTNRISYNTEHDLVNIRLLSICPPSAKRPYFQEGFLAATDDITWNYQNKKELDFNNRLLGKFKISTDNFWDAGNKNIPYEFLLPSNDPMRDLCSQLKIEVEKELRSGDIGEFLKAWSEIEAIVIGEVRRRTERNMSMGMALNYLFKNDLIDENSMFKVDTLRRFRNKIVHTPKELKPEELTKYSLLLMEILSEMNVFKSRFNF